MNGSMAKNAAAFRVSAFALSVLLVGANLASPLYATFAHQLGFDSLILTMIYATYVGTLIPSLVLAPVLAYRWGFRSVVGFGLVAMAAGVGLFAIGTSAGVLFAARAMQGVAVGMSSGALSAALAQTEPRGDVSRGAVVATAVTTFATGAGPVLAGALAEVSAWPTKACFLAEGVAVFAALGGLLWVPNELGRSGVWRAPRLPRIPGGRRRSFWLACCYSALAWAVTAAFLSVVPTLVHDLVGGPAFLASGAAAGALLLLSGATQLVSRRWVSDAVAQRMGALVLVGALAILGLGSMTGSVTAILVAASVGGIGQGLAFMGALGTVTSMTADAERPTALSGFYVVTYLAVGVPVIGIGACALVFGLAAAIELFVGMSLLLLVALLVVSHSSQLATCDVAGVGDPRRRSSDC
ncbi:MFS transporter [Microbacterium sp. X-17]|uniref:MFS transporter n=1 Tax=Microbacterium sp. X-17 TaxID=3144404 RepID=UPI0031F592EB